MITKTNKALFCIFVFATLFCFAHSSQASYIFIEKNSEDFTYAYEANDLPSEFFTLYSPGNSETEKTQAVSVSNGILTIDTSGLTQTNLAYLIDGNTSAAWQSGNENYSVEIRLKVLEATNTSVTGGLTLNNGNHHGYFQIWPMKSKMELTTLDEQDNAADFVVFRIVAYTLDEPDGSNSTQFFRVYRNGEQISEAIATNPSTSGSNETNIFAFGDYLSSSGYWRAEIDYIRWDLSGAYAPASPTILEQKRSEDFPHLYEGNILPEDSGLGFELVSNNSALEIANAVSTDGDILTLASSELTNSSLSYQIQGGPSTNWDVATGGDYTVEIRAKIREATNSAITGGLVLEDGNSHGYFQIWTNQSKAELIEYPNQDNSSDFVIFRIASYIDEASQTQVLRIYRNGREMSVKATANPSSQNPFLAFGDILSSSGFWHAEIDYLRWDTTGAYAPVTTSFPSHASLNFESQYEGDVSPDDPTVGLGFVLIDPSGAASSLTSSDGVAFSIDTSLTNTTAYYTLTGGAETNWNPGTDFTLELRARISDNTNPTLSGGIGMNDGNSHGLFQLWDNKLKLELETITNLNHSDHFNTFRIVAFSADGSSANQRFQLYRNGELLLETPQNTSTPGTPTLNVGDFISSATGLKFDVDYLRWDTTGSYAPDTHSLSVAHHGVVNNTVVNAMAPQGLAYANNGDLILTFHDIGDMRPGAKSYFIRSSDEGQTWSSPYAILSSSNPVESVSAAVDTLPNGNILLIKTVFTSASSDPLERDKIDSQITVSQSQDDDGTNFGQEQNLNVDSGWIGIMKGTVIELANGDLILPAYWEEDNPGSEPVTQAGFYRSTDNGQTWGNLEQVFPGRVDSGTPNEATYLVIPNGDIIAYARIGAGTSNLWRSTSSDNGYTWTTAEEVANINGKFPAIVQLEDGSYLMAIGTMHPLPSGLTGYVTFYRSLNGMDFHFIGHPPYAVGSVQSSATGGVQSLEVLPSGDIYVTFYAYDSTLPGPEYTYIDGCLLKKH